MFYLLSGILVGFCWAGAGLCAIGVVMIAAEFVRRGLIRLASAREQRRRWQPRQGDRRRLARGLDRRRTQGLSMVS